MNPTLAMVLTIVRNILRHVIVGFLFTSGGILALAVFQKAFHLGLCP